MTSHVDAAKMHAIKKVSAAALVAMMTLGAAGTALARAAWASTNRTH